MHIQSETITFMYFVLIGVIFTIIFDFFRALRKIKKPTNNIVIAQDILYFVIITIVLIISILNINEEVFRLYLIIAIILGMLLYALLVANKVRNLFVILINKLYGVVDFVFLPVKVHIMFLGSICKKIKKCVKLCCKKKKDMIEFYHKKVRFEEHKRKGISKQKKEES